MTLKERLARPGLAVSALVHAGALVATLVAFSSNQRFQDEQETVPIAVITDNEFNQIMKGDKAAKEVRPDATAATEQVAAVEASQPPPPPPPAAAPPPPPPPPPDETPPTPPVRPIESAPLPPVPTPPVRDAEAVMPKPAPKPVPKPPVMQPRPVALKPPPRPKPPEKPVEKPKPDLLARLMQEQPPDPPPQPSPKPAPPRKPVPDAKPATEESHFDLTDITKLFTRDAPPQKGATAHDTSRVASLGSPTANAPKMSPSFWAGLDGLMEEQYRKCWSYLGLTTGQKYIPQVRVVYGADGSLQGQPVLINPPSNPSLQSLADSALRAVRHCNPLRIPEQYAPYYEEWKGRVLRFDPEEMAG